MKSHRLPQFSQPTFSSTSPRRPPLSSRSLYRPPIVALIGSWSETHAFRACGVPPVLQRAMASSTGLTATAMPEIWTPGPRVLWAVPLAWTAAGELQVAASSRFGVGRYVTPIPPAGTKLSLTSAMITPSFLMFSS
jgi:hypothetical protein